MDYINQIALQIDIFLVIMARVTGIFLTAPLLGSRNVPVQVKMGLSIVVSFMILLLKKIPGDDLPNELWPLVFVLVNEMVVGLVIGFVAQFVFVAIQVAGQIIDMQIGYNMANLIDPLFNISMPLIGNFKNILAILVFLMTNSHHFLFTALFQCFDIVPVYSAHPVGPVAGKVTEMFIGMFITGLKISLPVLGAIFVVEVALGVIARTVPQMNVFLVGLPAKIFIGLTMMMLVMPVYVIILEYLFELNFKDIFELMKIMR